VASAWLPARATKGGVTKLPRPIRNEHREIMRLPSGFGEGFANLVRPELRFPAEPDARTLARPSLGADQIALELGGAAHDSEHQAAVRCRGVRSGVELSRRGQRDRTRKEPTLGPRTEFKSEDADADGNELKETVEVARPDLRAWH
jgi:hypothetical protein